MDDFPFRERANRNSEPRRRNTIIFCVYFSNLLNIMRRFQFYYANTSTCDERNVNFLNIIVGPMECKQQSQAKEFFYYSLLLFALALSLFCSALCFHYYFNGCRFNSALLLFTPGLPREDWNDSIGICVGNGGYLFVGSTQKICCLFHVVIMWI